MKNLDKTLKTVFAAMFLALSYVMPFLTGQIPEIGSMLCPMHIPVLLCGFICGPTWGMAVGFITPILRSMLFGAPIAIVPNALAMAFELATYAFVAGILYKKLNKNIFYTFIALIASMVAGRLVWGAVMFVLILANQAAGEIGFSLIWGSTVLQSIPGIILQLVAIPPIITVLRKNRLMLN